jgi:hypothetical protein
MKTKQPIEPRATWRDRFLQIAREAEAGMASRSRMAAGLRRPRISVLASRRVRVLAPMA